MVPWFGGRGSGTMSARQSSEISPSGNRRGDEEDSNSCNGGPSGASSSSSEDLGRGPRGIYRLMCTQQCRPKDTDFGHTKKSQDMRQEPPLQMWSDMLLPRYVYQKPFIVKFPEKCEWQNWFNAENKWGLVWYTDGSKTKRLVLGCINGA